jgi:hypothetical protein
LKKTSYLLHLLESGYGCLDLCLWEELLETAVSWFSPSYLLHQHETNCQILQIQELVFLQAEQ